MKIIPIANKHIIENICDGVLVIDNLGQIVHLNGSGRSMLNLESSDLEGKKAIDYIPLWSEINSRIISDMNKIDTFVGMINENYYSFTITDLIQKDIKIGNLIMFKDITKEKISEKRISKLNEHLELVNKILSHDISNNLMIANTSLDLMDDSCLEYKEMAKKSISKSMDLISRMKDFESSIGSDNKLTRYNLYDIINDVSDHFENVEVKLKGNCHILANDAIHSIFDNMLNNAIVHGKSKKIDIKVDTDGNRAFVHIMDNGVGIPDEEKKNIFQYGYSYGHESGTGYGLFLAKKVMEMYGGDIVVKDNFPTGTIFTLIFFMLKKDN